MKITAAIAVFSASVAGAAQASCGDDPCLLDAGSYRVALPPEADSPAPMVVFLHGAGSSGAGSLSNRGMVSGFQERGYAVVAPTGSRQFGSGGYSWNFFPGWEGRDEIAFLKQVAEDAAERFDLDDGHVLLAGFSAGGFMVNYLACAAPDTFSAYAPVAGGFWRPHPETCEGPVRLHHTHGWRDGTVPLEGRYLRNGTFQQGDIFAGLEIWRAANHCPDENPTAFDESGRFWQRGWTECAPNSALDFALHPGGHSVPQGWAGMVLDWFEDGPAG